MVCKCKKYKILRIDNDKISTICPEHGLIEKIKSFKLTIAGGIHGDDSVEAQGDYIFTIENMLIEFEKMGLKGPFRIKSQAEVKQYAGFGKHLFNNGKSERDKILKMEQIEGWDLIEDTIDYRLIITDGFNEIKTGYLTIC